MKRRRRTCEEIKKAILEYLKKQTFGRTTGQIAGALRINWDSANKYLRQLKNEELVFYEKVGRQNQWCLMEYYKPWKNKLSEIGDDS